MTASTISSDRIKDLFNAVTDVAVQTESFWHEVKKSIARRNAMVHKGHKPTQAEADLSIQTAASFVTYVLEFSDGTKSLS